MNGRLASLDVLRGITVAAMVVVNSPGLDAAYAPLRHARWDGCTAADLVFPFFLFIMGAAMAFASPPAGWRPVLRRAAVLVGLGLLLNAVPHWQPATLRLPGVLQRIAACYAACVLAQRALGPRGQAALCAALLAGYWALLGGSTAPDNPAARFDRLLLGRHTYHQGPFDPEGLLSTLPAVATALCGRLAGVWLRSARPAGERAAGLAAAGAAAAALGALWGLGFPLNKQLWTSSFALYTAGWAALALAACHWLVDLRGRRAWAGPFEALGANAIAAYVLHLLVLKALVYTELGGTSFRILSCRALFGGWLPPRAASAAFAVSYAALWAAALTPLYRRGILLKA